MPADWSDDDVLFRDLGVALDERSAMPESIARAGRDLYVWRNVDAELSELVADSADSVAATPAAMARADDQSRRSLTFRATQLTIEVDLERDPDVMRGQVIATETDGVTPDVITVESPGSSGPTSFLVDEVGYFAIEQFTLPVRLRCGGVVTPWID